MQPGASQPQISRNLMTADTEEIHVRYMYLSAGASIWYIDESVFPLCYHTCLQSEGMEPRSCKDDTLVQLELMLQVLVHVPVASPRGRAAHMYLDDGSRSGQHSSRFQVYLGVQAEHFRFFFLSFLSGYIIIIIGYTRGLCHVL